MMQRLLAFTLSSNKFTSSSCILLRSQPFSPLYKQTLNKPVSTFASPSSFIKQSASSAGLFTNSIPSYAANNLSRVAFHGVFSKFIFATLGSSLTGYGIRFFRPGFPKRGFGFKHSFSSQIGGWRSRLSRLSSDDVVVGLIVANVAVFMLWRVADQQFMFNNFTLSLNNFKSGRVHTMITSAFSHIDVGHIVSNMVGLYFFGTSIGRYFGSEYLVKLYLAGAIGGSIFYLIQHAFITPSSEGRLWNRNSSNVPALLLRVIPGLCKRGYFCFTDEVCSDGVCSGEYEIKERQLSASSEIVLVAKPLIRTGASGAVNAIMLLNIFLYPRATLYLDFIIPVPAILLGIFLIGKDMLRIVEGDQQISGSAHLGGAVVAAIAWRRIKTGRF